MTTPNNSNKPVQWFEELYAQSDVNGSGVPWAKMTANPHLLRWLQQNPGHHRPIKTLVVGCGLGDDAEALAECGYDVTAFDVSESAIALCRRRFPQSKVDYVVGDLLKPPETWIDTFPFVFENITVQSLPPEYHQTAIENITRLVAPGGHLLMQTWVRADGAAEGPPWFLPPRTVLYFETVGLRKLEEYRVNLAGNPSIWQVQNLYQRPVETGNP